MSNSDPRRDVASADAVAIFLYIGCYRSFTKRTSSHENHPPHRQSRGNERHEKAGKYANILRPDEGHQAESLRLFQSEYKSRGFRKTSGGPVPDLDLLLRLEKLIIMRGTNLTWEHVKSHSGILGNERADRRVRRVLAFLRLFASLLTHLQATFFWQSCEAWGQQVTSHPVSLSLTLLREALSSSQTLSPFVTTGDPALASFGLCRVSVTDHHMQAYRIAPVHTSQHAVKRRRLGGGYGGREIYEDSLGSDISDLDAERRCY